MRFWTMEKKKKVREEEKSKVDLSFLTMFPARDPGHLKSEV